MLKGLGIIVVLLIVLMTTSCGGKESAPVAEAEEPEILTPTSFVTSVVGEKTNHSEEELKDPIISARISGEALNIKLIGNDNFSTNAIKLMMLKRAGEIYEQAFDLFPRVDLVYIEWQYPLIDTYGNMELKPVMTIDLSRETENKINWDNFTIDNLPTIADSYWQHPVLN